VAEVDIEKIKRATAMLDAKAVPTKKRLMHDGTRILRGK
jgi:hypothetical protein